MTQDQVYIAKLKSLNWANATIAEKLGISEAEVAKAWAALQNEVVSKVTSGYSALIEQLNNTCRQYSSLGENLMVTAKALAENMTEEELRELVTDDKETTVQNLLHKAIVLRPFTLPTTPPPSAIAPAPILDPNSRQ